MFLCNFVWNCLTFDQSSLVHNLYLWTSFRTFFPHLWCQLWIFQPTTNLETKLIMTFANISGANLSNIIAKSFIIFSWLFLPFTHAEVRFSWCSGNYDGSWEILVHLLPYSFLLYQHSWDETVHAAAMSYAFTTVFLKHNLNIIFFLLGCSHILYPFSFTMN